MPVKKLRQRHRFIALLTAAGKTPDEIAHALDLHPKSVRRLLRDPAIKGLVEQQRQGSMFAPLERIASLSTQSADRVVAILQGVTETES